MGIYAYQSSEDVHGITGNCWIVMENVEITGNGRELAHDTVPVWADIKTLNLIGTSRCTGTTITTITISYTTVTYLSASILGISYGKSLCSFSRTQ